jgi:hypothetical protein
MYEVFKRTWWKHNPLYPDSKEPSIGRAHVVKSNLSLEEAQKLCKEINSTPAIKKNKWGLKAELRAQ